MSNFEYKLFYRRNLPHIQPNSKTLFVTFRLAGSIPIAVLEQIRAQGEAESQNINSQIKVSERKLREYEIHKRTFGRWDQALDNSDSGPTWLAESAVATIVKDAIHFRHPVTYLLDAFCIMPNHVHMIFTPANDTNGQPFALQTIMHSLKRFTALSANKVLGREGQFWHHENYDHYVRDEEEWQRIVRYVLNNPVKAGLVDDWADWPWSYWRET